MAKKSYGSDPISLYGRKQGVIENVEAVASRKANFDHVGTFEQNTVFVLFRDGDGVLKRTNFNTYRKDGGVWYLGANAPDPTKSGNCLPVADKATFLGIAAQAGCTEIPVDQWPPICGKPVEAPVEELQLEEQA